jgi:hypothetical protein
VEAFVGLQQRLHIHVVLEELPVLGGGHERR